jgi:hypothetical protein
MADQSQPDAYAGNFEHLTDELRRVDLVIRRWLAEAPPASAGGLYVTRPA